MNTLTSYTPLTRYYRADLHWDTESSPSSLVPTKTLANTVSRDVNPHFTNMYH